MVRNNEETEICIFCLINCVNSINKIHPEECLIILFFVSILSIFSI